MKEETVCEGIPHFSSRTCRSCNDDGRDIFTLEALSRETDNLKDKKAIGVDKACPIISKRCKIVRRDRCLFLPEELL